MIDSFPRVRQEGIAFKENMPANCCNFCFISKHHELTLLLSLYLEAKLADALMPENIATHFARIRALMYNHGINEPKKGFNLDE